MVQLINIASGNGEPRSNAVFVHGLGGDLYGTWQGGDGPRCFWPCWLAEDIKKLAVYLVGYEASVSRWRGSAMHLSDRATSILARLLAEPALRKGSFILIGHSLGGLVIKQMLRTCRRSDQDAQPVTQDCQVRSGMRGRLRVRLGTELMWPT